MRVVISSTRQAHYRLPANSLVDRGHDVTFYSSVPRSKLHGFRPTLKTRFVPAPVSLVNGATRISMPVTAYDIDTAAYDWMAAKRLLAADLVLGGATGSLYTLRAAHKQGSTFVLDRACPHIQFQQDLMAEEARKVGGVFKRHASWFYDRQLQEYEEADVILSPSEYSRSSFPDRLREKVVLAPIFGRPRVYTPDTPRAADTFTVGVVGGHPLRKGYVYLLEAWKRLALPNARLLLRTSPDLRRYPALDTLVGQLPNVEFIPYLPNIGDFYAQCDAFILPSVDDGFGMALFEAIANGVPSIATRNCGASELLTDGEDCLLIEAGSVEAIQESLLRLYSSSDLREHLRSRGRITIAALQQGDSAGPYEAGIDRMLEAVANLRSDVASPQTVASAAR